MASTAGSSRRIPGKDTCTAAGATTGTSATRASTASCSARRTIRAARRSARWRRSNDARDVRAWRDADVREAIRTRVDENMCVEAGAGTGKTTVLVDRIVADRRVRARADATRSPSSPSPRRRRPSWRRASASSSKRRCEHPADEGERERLEAALRDLNRAHIETIHAFAASLLRERPIEAGLDPGFEVLEDLPAQLDFEAAYDEWLTAEMAPEPPPERAARRAEPRVGVQARARGRGEPERASRPAAAAEVRGIAGGPRRHRVGDGRRTGAACASWYPSTWRTRRTCRSWRRSTCTTP